MFDHDKVGQDAKIKVVGVGGGGNNAINTMMESDIHGVEFVVLNTDRQALAASLAPQKFQLGKKGLGAGADPDVGREAALENREVIAAALEGADMVFITAGMGGGTGTGAAPVVANIARSLGALTVGVVTKPFFFEGNRRRRSAEAGIMALRDTVDTLITVPNQRLMSITEETTSMINAFKRVDMVLLNAVQGISDLITYHGIVNVDFADVCTIMSNQGMALMGSGRASGSRRAQEAATQAVSSPLLEDVSIEGATGLLINVTGGPAMTLHEIHTASTLIQEAADDDANIIFGSVIDETMGDDIKVTVIATGFERALQRGQNEGAHKSAPPEARPFAHHAPQASKPVQATEERYGRGEERQEQPPTIVRNRWAEERTMKPRSPERSEMATDEYDIPAFLRHKADGQ